MVQRIMNLFYLSTSPIKVSGRILTPDWLPCTSSHGISIADNGLRSEMQSLWTNSDTPGGAIMHLYVGLDTPWYKTLRPPSWSGHPFRSTQCNLNDRGIDMSAQTISNNSLNIALIFMRFFSCKLLTCRYEKDTRFGVFEYSYVAKQ